MKRHQYINGERYKAIGFTYDGHAIGWIKCGENG